jgi:hypothetical protein
MNKVGWYPVNNVFSYKVWESLNDIDELEEKTQVILFTDVVTSSKLWKLHEKGMFQALSKHEERVESIIVKYGGNIIKTIGDSYMLGFEGKDSLFRSIEFSYELQKDLIDNPIKIKNKKLQIRLGIHLGPLYKKYVSIQGKKLMDYFGNTVNTASRMESIVSEPGEIVFSWSGNLDQNQQNLIKNWIEERKLKTQIIDYQHRCYKGNRIRSGRLLSDMQVHTCEPLSKLKGIAKVTAYRLKL